MAKKPTSKKQTAKKPSSKTGRKNAKQSPSMESKKSLIQKIRESRAERKLQKEKQRTKEIKKNVADKKKQKVAEVKAKQAAVKAKAIEQVESAVEGQGKRRSHPFLTLVLIAIIAGLSGVAVWQYRDTEVQKKNDEIAALEQTTRLFEETQNAIEAEKKAEEDKFKEITVDTFSVRVPREWSEQVSQLPLEESTFGDNNVRVTVVNSDSRNSTEQFVPQLDYVWQLSEDDGQIAITNQSLHCERFDTLNNNLDNPIREHNGFQVYCDSSSENVVIYALSTPEKYGTQLSNTYFRIEVKDVQQVRLEDIKMYIQSYRSL